MLPVARLGDKHVCPIHGPNAIISGGTTMVDGRPIARVGDATACGATIVVGSTASFEMSQAVAYLGSLTSHGGVIVEGSPVHMTFP
jgi:uncharacterized Zn-binding protein involved in type VI secretion